MAKSKPPLSKLDTQSSRLHYFTYYGPTIASQSLFYAGGYLSFLLAHISLVIGTFLPPCKGQGSICHIVRCRKHTSWAVALPLILLVAIMCLLLGVVAGHEPVMFASVYIGAELVATWALVTRYCFFPFETDWRQLIAVIGLYLFAFSDLIICLRGFVSTHHWIWGWFAWERTVYMVPYHMALLFVSFLIPITGDSYPTIPSWKVVTLFWSVLVHQIKFPEMLFLVVFVLGVALLSTAETVVNVSAANTIAKGAGFPRGVQLGDEVGTILVVGETDNFGYPSELLCAYRHHTTEEGVYRIEVSWSGDLGGSWSFLSTVELTENIGIWEPFLIYYGGLLHCFYSREGLPLSQQDIVEKQSSDDGVTWSDQYYVVSHTDGSRDGMPSVVILPDSSLVVVFEGFWTGVWGKFTVNCKRSCDSGNTWGQPTIIHESDGLRNSGAPFACGLNNSSLSESILVSFMTDEDSTDPVAWPDYASIKLCYGGLTSDALTFSEPILAQGPQSYWPGLIEAPANGFDLLVYNYLGDALERTVWVSDY
ncbi:/Sialidase superfamily/BNR/Asp-box repeat protein [Pelomyxa schiedti]|nr:/Sialidase superfamily/BNR/Asp-box repeat protein [Pelomyxa schiedti]